MKIGISFKIDVTKISKERLFKGAKGTYLDATAFIDVDEVDQYDNNGFIAESTSKEERDQGQQGVILGNVKVFYNDSGSQQKEPMGEQAAQDKLMGKEDDFDDSIPF